MKRGVCIGAGAAALVLLGAWAWHAAPGWVADPLVRLAAHTPVRVWTDRQGRPVWYERTYDGEWRFPIALNEIPPVVRDFVLNVEDARFYDHGGVDYLAALRALAQNAGSARIVSGASTISMQVAGLADPRPRGEGLWGRWARKLRQALGARRLERDHAKDEILTAYFNHLPYGGKIVGLKSAAAYYFGIAPGELTLAEASILTGIPQAPNRFRPDRHPEAARRRQRLVLDSQVRAGRLTPRAADAIFDSQRLRFRDFTLPTVWEEKGTAGAWSFVISPPRDPCETNACRLALDAALCADMRRMLARHLGRGVRDAAAVVIDVKARELVGYVGTIDFASPKGGQVDAVRAIRSAGSTLKPFIYLEALEGGLITPDTRLWDAPIRYGGYAPGNYDGTFHGEVSATEALAQSLNTPVVRLLATLGEGRMVDAFQRWGLSGSVKTNGLSLALGSAGYRLKDLAWAYARLAAAAGRDAAARPAVCQLAKMLRTNPLPGAPDLDVAWKTGTSNNLKDAWCFAFTPDYAVGVWYGNKDGRASDRLVGVEIAAPAAGEIMGRLHAERSPEIAWGEIRAAAGTVPGLLTPRAPLMILSPVAQTYRLPPGAETLTLDLTCSDEKVYWYWNGVGLGAAQKVKSRAFPAGRHRVVAVPEDPARKALTVEFSVARTIDCESRAMGKSHVERCLSDKEVLCD